MSKTSHTPGPWEIQELPCEDGETEPSYRVSGESTLFLTISPCADGYVPGQNEANAYLIKAAPDLLEALHDARKTLSYVTEKAPGYDWNADPLSLTLRTGDAFSKIDAAIAKAEGRDKTEAS